MRLEDFLELHQDGSCDAITIDEGPTSGKMYCEECRQEVVLESEWFEKIKDREVERFCIIGGGYEVLELIISIKPE